MPDATRTSPWRTAGRTRRVLLFHNTVCLLALLSGGCIVFHPRGEGQLTYYTEPSTRRGFWLYLPKDYVQKTEAERRFMRWPLVVTLHGMKPFDLAHRQALEWEYEADRYGFIVVAPELISPDLLRQFPLRERTPAFLSDEKAVVAILENVTASLPVNPRHVLVTSWSSGGYLCHYMLNQHPDRFTSLAARQSTFSPYVLDADAAAASIHRPILLISSDQDFPLTVRGAKEALAWYQTLGYTGIWHARLKGRGHTRTPEIPAAFFAEVSGRGPVPQKIRKILDQSMVLRGGRNLAFLRG